MTRLEEPIAPMRTKRSVAPRPAPEPVVAPVAKRSRIVTHLAKYAWLHLLLITGAMIFLFPFVWLVASSFKTDEEIAEPTWFPALPTFTARSPYVRPAPQIEPPIGIGRGEFQAVLPRLLEMTRAALAKMPLPSGAQTVDENVYRESAVATLVNKLAPKINHTFWEGGGQQLTDAYRQLLTPEVLSDALDDRLARLELRGLQIRTLDAHIFPLCNAKEFASKWKVVSGDAHIIEGSGGGIVTYNVSDKKPILFRYDFDFPAEPRELHKLMLSLRPDDSWHRVDVWMDIGGVRWTCDTSRTSYLAQNRAASFIYQPPTYEDDTFKNKIWVPLKVGAGIPNGRQASLFVKLTPSSTGRAIWGKVQRNYSRTFYAVPFWRYVGNSILLVALTMAGTLFSSAFVAYAFARLHWPGKSVAFVILLSTMMLPAQVTMIPSFLIWRNLGWYNTLNPLWVPAWFGGAFFIFLMVQHMKTIPRELEEAARLDGLGPFRTWALIILPQVKPSLAAIAIMTFMGAWNEFMGPLIYLRDQAKFPLSLGLFGIRVDAGTVPDWTLIMSGNVLMTLPVIIVFFLFQRYFIQGMTMSGLKG
jgi:multiple sugar transport system permease protein